jgi:hypothetical protein
MFASFEKKALHTIGGQQQRQKKVLFGREIPQYEK